MDYEVVVGLEIHAELATKSKIYCSCTTEFGGEPNTHCCPVCMGMPGALPVLNKSVVEYAIRAGLVMNCQIASYSKQDRKNYFYPDLPKGYQISQYDIPLCSNGYIDIEVNGARKRIGITRIHIEEDAGKLIHNEEDGSSLIDYNRCGVPLIEIVSEPDIRSSQEARIFVEKIKTLLQYTGVSDCKMQEGSLRVDVNVSVRPIGQREFGTRTEMKNLSSFRSLVKAIDAEAKRQINELEHGRTVIQETRRWDETRGESFSMRNKEEAHDYRYFPEPDLVPIIVDEHWIEKIRKSIPELPDSRKERFIREYLLPEYDAEMITSSKILADFFEKAVEKCNNPKAVSNWIMGNMMRILKDRSLKIEEIPFPAEYLAQLITLIEKGIISGTIAKNIFEKMFDSKKQPEEIIREEGLQVVDDEELLSQVICKAIEDNPKSVEDYKAGKKKALGFLVGQVMKLTKGKADAQIVNRLLKEKLGD